MGVITAGHPAQLGKTHLRGTDDMHRGQLGHDAVPSENVTRRIQRPPFSRLSPSSDGFGRGWCGVSASSPSMKGCIAAIAETIGIAPTAWLDSTRGAAAKAAREFAPGSDRIQGCSEGRRCAPPRKCWGTPARLLRIARRACRNSGSSASGRTPCPSRRPRTHGSGPATMMIGSCGEWQGSPAWSP